MSASSAVDLNKGCRSVQKLDSPHQAHCRVQKLDRRSFHDVFSASDASEKNKCSEFEDAKSSEFNRVPPISISWAQLLEPKGIENERGRGQNVFCLGRRGSGVRIAPPRPKESTKYGLRSEAVKSSVADTEDAGSCKIRPPARPQAGTCLKAEGSLRRRRLPRSLVVQAGERSVADPG
jgi:hypothetical protein